MNDLNIVFKIQCYSTFKDFKTICILDWFQIISYSVSWIND